MSGSYEEKLKTGGKLIVKNDNWYIQYYFPGPDLRYNGKFLSLDGNCIDNYISSWKENFEKCKKLEKEIPENGNYDIEGKMGMYIHIHNGNGYVTLDRWHFPIYSENELNFLLNDYAVSKAKAKIIMETVSSIAKMKINLNDAYNESYEINESNHDKIIDALCDGETDLFKIHDELSVSFLEIRDCLNEYTEKGYISKYSLEIDWLIDPSKIKRKHSEASNHKNGYSDDEIALAYNLLMPTNNKPFTKKKALTLFNGKFDESMLYKLDEIGLIEHNKKDDDWVMNYLCSNSTNKNGVYWYMKYQLKQCDPLVEKVLDLYVMKYKRDFDYIEEKLDISHERMMKIIKEISEICSINIYRVEADLYDTLMDNFYTFKPLNVKKNNKT